MMRIARGSEKHIHAKRLAREVDGNLQAREPALINLPIPLNLPTLPIVGPILTQVVAGQVTTTTPASAPTPTSSNGSGNGNQGGGNDGGNSNPGGNSGDSSNGGSNSSGGGVSSGDGSSGGSNGGNSAETSKGNEGGGGKSGESGGGSSDGGSSQHNGGENGTSSGGNQTPTSNHNGDSGSGSSPEGTNAGEGTKAGPGGGVDASTPMPSDSSNSTSSASTVAPGVVNASTGRTDQDDDSSVANTPGNGGSSGSQTGNSPVTTGNSGTSKGTTTNSNTTIGGSSGATPSDTPVSSGDGQSGVGLSGGAIAGIVLALIIIILCLMVFVLRRRSMTRRSERRLRWWSRRNAPSPQSAKATVGSGTASVRSSFATTFDHGLSPHLTLTFDASGLPEVPPMAEIRDSPTTRGPVALSPLLINVESERRISVYSTHSDGSEDGQYLVIHPSAMVARPKHDFLAPDATTPTSLPTPMSVRPFSPSESFAFPKPPGKRASEWSTKGDGSRPTSMKSGKSVPRRPVPPLLDNPFADPGVEAKEPFQENAEFAEVEFIQRPFRPTLDDEIAVVHSDRVRVVQTFDDGWAFVEKMVGENQTQSGLIPIDCLRAENQDLPTFLASKRVSSYSNAYLAI